MSVECTPYDHSYYKRATNHWGLERKAEHPIKGCEKCGRAEFVTWFRALHWTTTDRDYWKRVFRDAREQKVFFFAAVPPNYHGQHHIWVDADVDPGSILCPTVPDFVKGGLDATIIQERYRQRQKPRKEHDYGEFQPGIDVAVAEMVEDLEYVDNIRCAALDSRKDMRRFREAEAEGCCGSTEQVVEVLGRKFIIGCNFGH